MSNSTAFKFSLLNHYPKNAEALALVDISKFDPQIDALSEFDRADCLFRAALIGNEMLMRRVVERVGLVPVEFVNEHIAKKCTLNGERFSVGTLQELSGNHSPAALKSLIKTINEFGMKGLIDHGPTFPALFRKLSINSDYLRMDFARFDGDLPSLTEGLLVDPELAIVLAEESEHTCTPAAYRPVLCWAPEAMICDSRHLAPIEVLQEVQGLGTMAEWKASASDADNLHFRTIVTGLKPADCVQYTNQLVKTMGPLSQIYGFADPQGRILCETTTDFLLSFQMAGVCESKMKAAQDFVKNYCPLDIMAIQAAEALPDLFTPMDFNVDLVTFHSGSYNELFALLSKDHPLRARALDIMEPEQWKELYKKANGPELSATSIIAMYETFGVDNTGHDVKIRYDDIAALKAANYRFSPETKFFDDEKTFGANSRSLKGEGKTSVFAFMNASLLFNPDDYPEDTVITRQFKMDRITEHFTDLANLGIWPSNSLPPTDFKEAVKMAGYSDLSDTTNNRSMALRGILVGAGIDACVQAISAPKQWMKVAEIFPRSEFAPYMKLMPNKQRGKLLEQEMGL